MSDYLNMVSKKPQDTASVENPAQSTTMEYTDQEAADNIVASLLSKCHSSSFRKLFRRNDSSGSAHTASPDWQELLTSPFMDDSPSNESPFDAILETPMQTAEWDFLTSPVVADNWDPDSVHPGLDLVSNPSNYDAFENSGMVLNPLSVTQKTSTSLGIGFDVLYTISPSSPALASFSPQIDGSTTSSTRSKTRPTGTRKNITAESLVPLDAPTQPRTYVAPSTTSRKELPMVFARKRARHVAFDDEEDELEAEADPLAIPPTASEADAIAAKRRQNTLAARRSRKRKLEYQRQLEEELERQRMATTTWQKRALLCQAKLIDMGVSVTFNDEA